MSVGFLPSNCCWNIASDLYTGAHTIFSFYRVAELAKSIFSLAEISVVFQEKVFLSDFF